MNLHVVPDDQPREDRPAPTPDPGRTGAAGGGTVVSYGTAMAKLTALVVGLGGILIIYTYRPDLPWIIAASAALVAGLLLSDMVWLTVLALAFRQVQREHHRNVDQDDSD